VSRRAALGLLLALLAAALPGRAQAPASAPAAGGAPDPVAGTDVRQVAGEPLGEPLTGAALDRRTAEVAGLLRCPVCQGLSIADSPASLAKQMKALVREMLAAGYVEGQILDYFAYSYGQFVLLKPSVHGISSVLWIAPGAALLLGGGALAWGLRRKAKRSRAAGGGAAAAESPEDATPAPAVNAELAPYLERVRRLTAPTSHPAPPREAE
jgi:cytochrome c-type biogenesis protein CcmH